VTLRAPGGGGDYSVICETATATESQTVTFKVSGGLSGDDLCVWRTNKQEPFARQPDVHPTAGAFTLVLDPLSIYTISTTRGQQRGAFDDVPQAKPFPFPFYETYDHYMQPKRWGYLPYYTADICGVFEISDRPDGNGKCLRQVLDRKSNSWAPEWMPYTVLGDENWKDYEVGADVFVENGGWAGVMGRANNTGNGWEGNPNGYYVRLYADGGCALYVADQQLKGARERQLATGAARRWKWNQWHNVKLRFSGATIAALVDGDEVLSVTNDRFDHGLAGLITCGEANARVPAMFDNLIVAPVGAAKPEPTVFVQDQTPLYDGK